MIRRRPALPLVLALSLLLGCSGQQSTPESSDPIATAPTSTPAEAPHRILTDGQATPEEILEDLGSYWAAEFPDAFDRSFVRLASGGVSLDSGVSGPGALCLSTAEQILGNAYYCPQSDGIVYDTGVLVPVLRDAYGPGALAASLAHEYGHAVAARIGPTVQDRAADPDRFPVLFIELQADCYAGAYLEARGGSELQEPAWGKVVAPLLDFRDPVSVDPTSPTAHGLGLDRLQALLFGAEHGVARCHELSLNELAVTLNGQRDPGGRRWTDANKSAVIAEAAPLPVGESTSAPLTPAGEKVDLSAIGEMAEAGWWVWQALTAEDSTTAACRLGSWVADRRESAVTGGSPTTDLLGGRPGDADEVLDLVRSVDPSRRALADFVAGFTGSC